LERAGQTREREPSIISLTNTDKPERQTFLGARRASKKRERESVSRNMEQRRKKEREGEFSWSKQDKHGRENHRQYLLQTRPSKKES
jgi:hypothetical protein